MKRGSDVLTGGTKDVNLQILTIKAEQSGVDADTDVNVFVPVQRLNTRNNRSIVLEILWVDWFLQDSGVPLVQSMVQGILTTNQSPSTGANIALQDARNLSIFRVMTNTGTASNAGFQTFDYRYKDIIHDGAGHGLLVATDQMTINIQSTATTLTNRLVCRIGYRWKEVALVEYIGIVQSQQV